MRKPEFWGVYLLLLIAQLLLSNYFTFSPYLMLSILPVMVLCIPLRVGSAGAMLIAFASGLTVDLLSEGVLGLNALALVPVALVRNSLVRIIFGEDLFTRNEDFSAGRSGFGKVALALFAGQLLYTVLYVWVDAAGTRPLWFNLARGSASLALGFLVSLTVVGLLAPDPRK